MFDRGLWRYIRFFENPVDFINSPVYRDGCEFSVIFPENPVGLAGMPEVYMSLVLRGIMNTRTLLNIAIHESLQFSEVAYFFSRVTLAECNITTCRSVLLHTLIP